MLETPLFGRFGKENRRLVFGPTRAYDTFVNATAGVGALLFLSSFRSEGLTDYFMGFSPEWCFFIGLMVLGASVWAYLSLVRISFDLKNGTFWRRQGPGFLPRMMTGKVADLDALVLIAESNAGISGGVTYHLVLHWKQNLRVPLMVVQNDTRNLRPGEPLQSGGVQLMQQGAQYAKALGIPFYDNSHFASKCPVPVF
jgi:hypothetical protein